MTTDIALIKHRRGLAADWTSTNPILEATEFGVESDTHLMKMGDGSTSWTSLGYMPEQIAAQIHTAIAKATPVDADEFPMSDSADSNKVKKTTWAQIKTVLKAYFDSATQTLTNKSINFATNTVTMTKAELNAALSDADVVTLTGTESPTNKDLSDASNTFPTLVGSQTYGATGKTTPVDADVFPLSDSAASNALKKVTFANIKATLKTYFDSVTQIFTNKDLTDATNTFPVLVGTQTHAATGKTTLVDGDEMPLSDSAASYVAKKVTFSNLKASLKTYFDTLYSSGSTVHAATSKTTPVDADEIGLVDSAASWGDKKLTWANLKATLFTSIGSLTGKTTPVDADTFALSDSAASSVGKSLTFANLKATLKAYFDTLYITPLSYTTTATAAGTTTLTSSSTRVQFFTGTSTQTVALPVTSTLGLGWVFEITNNSTGAVTVQSSGGNTVLVIPAGIRAVFTCILASGTTAASWSAKSEVEIFSALHGAMNNLSTGIDVVDRRFTMTNVGTLGTVYLTCFTATKTMTVSQISVANVGASSGLTLARMGLYTFDESTFTLVAQTASDTTLFNSTNTTYTRSFDSSVASSYQLVAGQRYAIAVIQVGTTAGTLVQWQSNTSSLTALSPRTNAQKTSQSDLPSSITSFSNANTHVWGRLS